jgi:hypothetical protein
MINPRHVGYVAAILVLGAISFLRCPNPCAGSPTTVQGDIVGVLGPGQTSPRPGSARATIAQAASRIPPPM